MNRKSQVYASGEAERTDEQLIPILGPHPTESPASVPINFSFRREDPMELISYVQPISIRRFCLEDVSSLYEAVRESIVPLCDWMTWCGPDYSVEESRAFVMKSAAAWAKGEEYNFAIVDRKAGTVLGSVALNQLNRAHGFANIGYWVRRSRNRHGIASAATLLIARFGLSRLGLNRLEILVPTDNVASQRVAQKAGAKFEGVFRRRLVLGGRVCDAAVYSLVPEDLPGNRSVQSGSRASG